MFWPIIDYHAVDLAPQNGIQLPLNPKTGKNLKINASMQKSLPTGLLPTGRDFICYFILLAAI
jgi:hypothetical protein